MGFLELFLIGVGLSMDAFAVAICQGLSMTRIKWGHALTVGLYFGGFQALMPLLGWVLGSQFSGYIQQYDHWVAFILLLLIGGNMIREALSGEEDEAEDTAAGGGPDHKSFSHGHCHQHRRTGGRRDLRLSGNADPLGCQPDRRDNLLHLRGRRGGGVLVRRPVQAAGGDHRRCDLSAAWL